MVSVLRPEMGVPAWVDVVVETPEQHEQLRAFLSSLFDWSWTLGEPESGHYAYALHDGAPVMGLSVHEGARGEMTTYFATDDVAASLTRAEQLGARVSLPVTPIMELGTMALLVDPTGATVGLWQPGTFSGFGAAFEVNSPGWFDHVSPDPEGAAHFYSSLTGHTTASPEEGMRVLQRGDRWFASLSLAPRDVSARWNPVMVVDSLARVREAVPRRGGTILVDEVPVPGSALCVFTEPVNGTAITVMASGNDSH